MKLYNQTILSLVLFVSLSQCLQIPFISNLLDRGDVAHRPSFKMFEGENIKDIIDSIKTNFQSFINVDEEDDTVMENFPIDLSQYDGFKIIRFQTIDVSQNVITELLQTYDKWEMSSEFIDFKVPAKDLSQNPLLTQNKDKYIIIINDLSKAIYESFPKTQETIQLNTNGDIQTQSDLFFKEYRPLTTIYSWLDILKETFPNLVSIEWLGQTFEGREMKAIHLSSPNGLNPQKKTIVITAGVHAREWISVSTALFIIYQILIDYGVNAKTTKYLDHLDFLIVPVFNPDGYDYTWTNDRLWRKNRQETYLPKCFGIDIDHSFGYRWTKSRDYPCGESYSGEVEFEAIEAENLNNYINITKNDHDIYGFLDLHSYTQKVLYPYAHSCQELPRDHENLLELAYGLSKTIRLTKGKHYEVLSACKDRGVDLLPGLGAGSSLDYMYHNRAHWAFQFKLRDTGSHGFLLPNNFIIPVGKEIFSAVRYFCEFILNPDLYNRSVDV